MTASERTAFAAARETVAVPKVARPLHIVPAPRAKPSRTVKRVGAQLVSRPTPTLDPMMAVVYAIPRNGRRRIIKTIRLEPEDWSVAR